MRTIRVLQPAIVLAGAAAMCVACSTSTGGTPATSNPPGSSIGTLPRTPSALPSFSGIPSVSGLPSISGVPSIGGDQANTAFCKDFKGFNPSSFSTDPTSAESMFDKLAEDAPDSVKPDADKVRDFIHNAANGNFNSSDMQAVEQAITNLVTYAEAHCAA